MPARSLATVAAALALVIATVSPVAAAGKAFGSPKTAGATGTGAVKDCALNGTTIAPGATCIALTFTGADLAGGNVNWSLPAGTTIDLASADFSQSSCTVTSSTLVLTGGGPQARDVTCSSQSLVVTVTVTSGAFSTGSYPLGGSYKTVAGGRTNSNMYAFTYTLIVSGGCGPVGAPNGTKGTILPDC